MASFSQYAYDLVGLWCLAGAPDLMGTRQDLQRALCALARDNPPPEAPWQPEHFTADGTMPVLPSIIIAGVSAGILLPSDGRILPVAISAEAGRSMLRHGLIPPGMQAALAAKLLAAVKAAIQAQAEHDAAQQ